MQVRLGGVALFVIICLLGGPGTAHAAPASAPAPETLPPPAVVRAAFRKLLDRPRVPLDPKVGARGASPVTRPDGLVTETLSIATQRKPNGIIERVPMLIVRPARITGRQPAVIVLHGTGSTKEQQEPWLARLAEAGYLALAIDARYHGDRAGGAKGAEAYVAAITAAWRVKPGAPQEHPFFYDTAWDLWRVVDYLETRADVDRKRIGMLGFSMGGIQAWLAAAVDTRVKVTVPAIAAQSFRWILDNDKWQGRAKTIQAVHEAAAKDLGEPAVNAKVCRALWAKVIPGIVDKFDCPSMLRLFAGRPLLLLNGELDPNCPLGGAQVAFTAAEQAFKEARASDKLKIMVGKGVAHKVTAEQEQATMEWFARWFAL